MEKISIIVPVYQAEKYLRQCIDSVLQQTFQYFELLLIDDGSKDNSGKICDEYAKKDSRVIVTHQKNQGPGIARNCGLSQAAGEWIMFLDSDDILDGEDALLSLVGCAKKENADIVVANYRRFKGETVDPITPFPFFQNIDTSTVGFRYKGFFLYNHLSYNWGKLYKRAFLAEHSIVFNNFKLAEDKLYNMSCYAWKPKYAFLNKSVVLYRYTDQSLTRQYDDKFIEHWIALAKTYILYLRSHKIEECCIDFILFHVFYGALFIVQMEKEQGRSNRYIANCLKLYSKERIVKTSMQILATGKYSFCVTPFIRKIIIWGASLAFSMHFYGLFAAAVGHFMALPSKGKKPV